MGYTPVPIPLIKNNADLSTIIEGFGKALIQNVSESEDDIQITLSAEGAVVLASALFEIVNSLNKESSN